MFSTLLDSGRFDAQIIYNTTTDLLYIQIDDAPQSVLNQQLFDDVVVDIGEGEQIVGIETLDASKRLDLTKLLPVEYAATV